MSAWKNETSACGARIAAAAGAGLVRPGGAARRAVARARRAAPRRVPGDDAGRGRAARARSAGPRARPRRLLRRPHQEHGRGNREQQLQRLADRPRREPLRAVAGLHERSGLHEPERRPRSRCTFPHEALAEHLFAYKPGWTATTEYGPGDERLPETLRKFCPEGGVHGMVVTPLVIGGRTLGWFKLATGSDASCDERAVVAHRAHRSDRPPGRAGAPHQPGDRDAAASRSGARRSSRSATGSRATSTTTSPRASARS